MLDQKATASDLGRPECGARQEITMQDQELILSFATIKLGADATIRTCSRPNGPHSDPTGNVLEIHS